MTQDETIRDNFNDEGFYRVPHTVARLHFRDSQRKLIELLRFIYEQTRLASPQNHDAALTMGHHSNTICELIVCRMVDNFQTYLTHLLEQVIMRYPLIVGKEATVKIVDVVQERNIDTIINKFAQETVNGWSYKSLSELDQKLQKLQGFKLFTNAEYQKRLEGIVQLRNLFVHNAGIINDRFLQKCPGYAGELGDCVTVEIGHLGETLGLVETIVDDIDRRAVEKWKLDTVEILTPVDL